MIRGFMIHSESWYADNVKLDKDVIDEITLGLYNKGGGGTGGEMTVSWIDIGEDKPSAQIGVSDDAFHLFKEFDDLFSTLPYKKGIQIEEFKEYLGCLGFKDLTKRGK